jgi:integrase
LINALIAKHHPKPDKNLVGHARYEKLEAYYRKKAYAENTYRSYKSDLKDFINWAEIDLPFPASVTLIKHYILDKADILAPTTLNHRIAALSFIHRYMGVDDPTKDTKVREILSGIRRDRLEDWESAQAPALTLSQIKKLINSIDNDVSGLRDRTLILVGLICAFRQSELSQLRIEWLEKTDDQGYVYRVKRSKTDQDATKRRYKVIPYGSGKMCPVKAIDDLISAMGVDKGPLFRGLSKSDKFLKNAMSHTSVNRIIKKRIGKSGIISDKDPIRCAAKINRYSCHSLRSSFITILRAMEVPDSKIMRQTHHTNINILEMYDRHDMQFKHSPATDFTNGLSNGEGD